MEPGGFGSDAGAQFEKREPIASALQPGYLALKRDGYYQVRPGAAAAAPLDRAASGGSAKTQWIARTMSYDDIRENQMNTPRITIFPTVCRVLAGLPRPAARRIRRSAELARPYSELLAESSRRVSHV
jgi:hypothetical protein